MGAADLDDAREGVGLGGERVAKPLHRREEMAGDLLDCRHVDGGGEHVVGRLRAVDVVVGVHRLLRPEHAAQELDGAVGDHLVGVHVGLGAAARLPDPQWKMLVELACDNFIANLGDQLCFVGGQLAEIVIDQRTGFLEDAESADHLAGHYVVADIEMEQATLGLRAPILVGGHFYLAR